MEARGGGRAALRIAAAPAWQPVRDAALQDRGSPPPARNTGVAAARHTGVAATRERQRPRRPPCARPRVPRAPRQRAPPRDTARTTARILLSRCGARSPLAFPSPARPVDRARRRGASIPARPPALRRRERNERSPARARCSVRVFVGRAAVAVPRRSGRLPGARRSPRSGTPPTPRRAEPRPPSPRPFHQRPPPTGMSLPRPATRPRPFPRRSPARSGAALGPLRTS